MPGFRGSATTGKCYPGVRHDGVGMLSGLRDDLNHTVVFVKAGRVEHSMTIILDTRIHGLTGLPGMQHAKDAWKNACPVRLMDGEVLMEENCRPARRASGESS